VNRRGAWQGADMLYFMVYIMVTFVAVVVLYLFPAKILAAQVQPIDVDAYVLDARVTSLLTHVDPFVGYREFEPSRGALKDRLPIVFSQKKMALRVQRGEEEYFGSREQKGFFDAASAVQSGVRRIETVKHFPDAEVWVTQVYPESYDTFG